MTLHQRYYATLRSWHDAVDDRSPDPTGTYADRRKGRIYLDTGLERLKKLVRKAVVNQDALGLQGQGLQFVIMSQGFDQTATFHAMFSTMVDAALRDAPQVIKSIAADGYKAGLAYAKDFYPDVELSPLVARNSMNMAANAVTQEMQGIEQALVQTSARVARAGINTRSSADAITRQIGATIDSIAKPRLSAMVNQVVVHAYAMATLDVFEAAGIPEVGIIAESIGGTHRHMRDAPRKTGPGSRTRNPSKRTLSRIRKVERRLEALRQVDVVTAGDDDVCQVCEDIAEDGPYPINAARELIPAHPHCRCKFRPVGDRRFARDFINFQMRDYSEDQPRVPAGEPGGGQWTSGGGAGSTSNAKDLYEAPTKTAEQIADEFGAGDKIAEIERMLGEVVPTNALTGEGGYRNADGSWTEERAALHDQILNDIFTKEAIAAYAAQAGIDPKLIILGGRGGSGKSWLTGPNGPIKDKALLLDSDKIKESLPEYKGWNAAQVHEESSHIYDRANEIAMQLRMNVINDGTLRSSDSMAKRMATAKQKGYTVEGYYMYASPEKAASRAMGRFSKGGTYTGRYVPAKVILGNTRNEANFDSLSSSMSRWGVYENNTDGRGPREVQVSWQKK